MVDVIGIVIAIVIAIVIIIVAAVAYCLRVLLLLWLLLLSLAFVVIAIAIVIAIVISCCYSYGLSLLSVTSCCYYFCFYAHSSEAVWQKVGYRRLTCRSYVCDDVHEEGRRQEKRLDDVRGVEALTHLHPDELRNEMLP